MEVKYDVSDRISRRNYRGKCNRENQCKIEEMEKESYRLVTMSFWGTERAVLVFKKGLKGSLL